MHAKVRLRRNTRMATASMRGAQFLRAATDRRRRKRFLITMAFFNVERSTELPLW
jgi:hypothetical protein